MLDSDGALAAESEFAMVLESACDSGPGLGHWKVKGSARV